MKSDVFSQIIFNDRDVFNALYSGIENISRLNIENSEDVERFNQAVRANADTTVPIVPYTEPAVSIEEFDGANQADWFMPDEYKRMDIEGFLVYQCPKQNYDRLIKELELFRQHNMMDLLKYLKYLVDTMRENNIVWGVGRGSSVASYVLYLIGIHKIDSIKYGLDINEFLKEKTNG